MSVFVLTPETVWNPAALKVKSVPRKLVGRIPILPRREAGWPVIARTVLDNQLLRFFAALTPFIAAMFLWPDLALPISQAPLAMLIVIGFVEMRVLRVPRDRRAAVMPEDEAQRTLDTLAFRGRALLSRIAAARGETAGELFLVVDQSDLARVPPLTVVSVQTEAGGTQLLDLDADERRMLREELFDAEFPDSLLLLTNLRENEFTRTVAFDMRGVTAHARLDALLARQPAATAVDRPA